MSVTYRSKIGLELAIPLSLVFIGVLIINLLDGKNWIIFAIIGILSAFITHLFMMTAYSIHDQRLLIKAGFVFKKTLDISSITLIRESRNLLSSPAASLDRLEIHYDEGSLIVVSPKEKKAFINALKAINPRIVLEMKEAKTK